MDGDARLDAVLGEQILVLEHPAGEDELYGRRRAGSASWTRRRWAEEEEEEEGERTHTLLVDGELVLVL